MEGLQLSSRFLLPLLASLLVDGFNVNVDNILKLNLPSSFRGINRQSAYFGYSLSFAKEDMKIWLYVGSPRANTTDQTEVSNPGAVFKCLVYDFYAASQPAEPCIYIPIDTTSDQPEVRIIKDDQWLGGTIFAASNSQQMLLACGYKCRFKFPNKTHNYAKGICYGIRGSNDVEKIYLTGANAAYLNGSNTSSVFKEGFAQYGASIGISKDSGDIAIGAPGLWQWRGGIVVKTNFESCFIDNLNLPEDSYLGYSVEWLNHHNNGGYETLVAGAPRADIFGKVFVIAFHQNCTSNILQTLNGSLFGSYFGASLLAVNLNSNQWSDLLLVGAPLFNQSNGDEGAVFMYRGDQKGQLTLIGQLKGSERRGARFGSAIQSLGDTNLDSYEDVVISSPYEDSGVIYIYLGTSDGLQLKYSQMITSSQIFGNQMQRIGYSMTSLININGYPVLAIGNHRNDTVAILSAQPIHGLEISVEFDNTHIEWSQGQCGARGEQIIRLNLTLRFTYKIPERESLFGLPYKFLSNISYEVEIDVLMRSGRRGYIESRGDGAWVEKVREIISFDENDVQDPITKIWTILFPITRQPNNISIPVVVAVNASQQQGSKKAKQNVWKSISDFIFLPPIFDSLSPNNFNSSIYFHKDCGVDDICQPNFKLFLNQSAPVAIINSQSPIIIPCRVGNNGESAYGVQIRITQPMVIAFDSVVVARDSCNRLLCLSESLPNFDNDPLVNTLINCELENPIRADDVLNFDLYFTWNKQIDWFKSPDTIGVKVAVKNNETSTEESIKIEAKFIGEIAEISKTIEQLALPDEGPLRVDQRMEIRNVGPGLIPLVSLNIFHLARANQINATIVDITHKQRVESLNGAKVMRLVERNVELSEAHLSNQKLPLLEDFLQQHPSDRDKHLTLDCSNLQCINLEGKINGFGVGDSIEISIIFNVEEILLKQLNMFESTTFVNEGHMTPAKFQTTHSDWSSGCCDVSSSSNCCGSELRLQMKSTVVKEEEVKPGPAIWVVILGIIMGVLALSLLVFLLWKCGFFRRTKHEQLIADKKRSLMLVSTCADQEETINSNNETESRNSGDKNSRISAISIKKTEDAKDEQQNISEREIPGNENSRKSPISKDESNENTTNMKSMDNKMEDKNPDKIENASFKYKITDKEIKSENNGIEKSTPDDDLKRNSMKSPPENNLQAETKL